MNDECVERTQILRKTNVDFQFPEIWQQRKEAKTLESRLGEIRWGEGEGEGGRVGVN